MIYVRISAVVLLIAILNGNAGAQSPFTAQSALRNISVDFTHITGKHDTAINDCIGADRAAVLLRPENLAQLAIVQEELGFDYIRFHGLLHDDMGVYREVDGQAVYDFAKVDALYDALLKLHIRPFVELSFMPHDLASGTRTIFMCQCNVTPPKDYARWRELITALISHLQDHYGAGEVKHWRFEVWNEPNYPGFWTGSRADYFKLYDVSAAAVKSVNADFVVGGPATAGCGWISEFIAHCAEGHIPIDFISTHTYSVSGGVFDALGKADTHLTGGENSVANEIKQVRKQIDASAMPKLPLHFTEWSTSYSTRDAIHDSNFSAAFICERIRKSQGSVDSMSYWAYSDLFEESGPPPTAFHGGFGLLTRDGLRKGSFFAYKYMKQLGAEELADNDAASWATRDRNKVQVLLWNYTQPAVASNRTYFRRLQPTADVSPIELKIYHLPAGNYTLTLHKTGYQANDAYSAYIVMGMPKDLSANQLSTLQAMTKDEAVRSEKVYVNADGLFATIIAMREDDVVLMTIEPQ